MRGHPGPGWRSGCAGRPCTEPGVSAHTPSRGGSGSFRCRFRGRIRRKGKRWCGAPWLRGFGAKDGGFGGPGTPAPALGRGCCLSRGVGAAVGGFTCAGTVCGVSRQGHARPVGCCWDMMVGEVWDESGKSLRHPPGAGGGGTGRGGLCMGREKHGAGKEGSSGKEPSTAPFRGFVSPSWPGSVQTCSADPAAAKAVPKPRWLS